MTKIVAGLELNDDVLSKEELELKDMKMQAERYVALSSSKSKIDAEMKRIKANLLDKFPTIPDKYKFTSASETVIVAGQSFVKTMKCINFEKVSIIWRQRIDTKLSREGLYAIIAEQRKKASTDEERKLLDNVKSEVDKMLNPHSTDVVEPRKNTRKRS